MAPFIGPPPDTRNRRTIHSYIKNALILGRAESLPPDSFTEDKPTVRARHARFDPIVCQHPSSEIEMGDDGQDQSSANYHQSMDDMLLMFEPNDFEPENVETLPEPCTKSVRFILDIGVMEPGSYWFFRSRGRDGFGQPPDSPIEPGALCVHCNPNGTEVWVAVQAHDSSSLSWIEATDGVKHPLRDDKVLHLLNRSEPRWLSKSYDERLRRKAKKKITPPQLEFRDFTASPSGSQVGSRVGSWVSKGSAV